MNLTCSKCKETKDSSQFHKNRAMCTGFHNHCKACRLGVDTERKLKNYYENRERYSKLAKEWKENNREHLNAYMVDYRKTDAFSYKTPATRFNRAKSRSRKLQQTPQWSDMNKIKRIYELCEELNTNNNHNFQVDHIYPIQGVTTKGLHVWYNLMVIPAKLNQSKGNKVLENTIFPRVLANFDDYLSELKIYAELALNQA